ncbi:MAG TPA: hypothetical protein VMU92_03415 [Acidobacteriaceae bacterium]|nr:hypothetical protein [Acidobacteriaceae bacterium]
MPRHNKHSATSESLRSDPLRDEVYRQMFLVEAGRPQAELHLAVAMLKAWSALEQLPTNEERRQWLRRVCPICVRMIESMLGPESNAPHSKQDGKRPNRRRGEIHGN